eukprot:scaffold22680_cov107-Cylindrotheca_fusiformis.AAC.17
MATPTTTDTMLTWPQTPRPQRRVESLDAMISQIDSERRIRREGEKRPHANTTAESIPTLQESYQSAKRQCLRLDLSLVSDDESEDESSTKSSPKIAYRQHWRRTPPPQLSNSLTCTLKPRNLSLELSPLYSSTVLHRIEDDLPLMPF